MSEPTKSLRDALTALLPYVDNEIEDRKHSGNDEDWAALEKASNAAHAALREPVPKSPDLLVRALRWIVNNPGAHPANMVRVAQDGLDHLAPPPRPFPETDVAVTLTGEEWTALLARTARVPLSEKGREVYNGAAYKLKKQLLAASDASPTPEGQRKPALTLVDNGA